MKTFLCGPDISDQQLLTVASYSIVAPSVHDFNNHTHSPDDMANHSLFDCKFCDESFGSLAEVMTHNKLIHTNNVQHCYNFLENICLYGDDCWFLHSESLQVSEPTFECKFCQQKFKTKNSLRKQMKLLHIQMVPACKSENECKFDPKNCWFVHQNDIDITYYNARIEDQRKSQNTDMEWKNENIPLSKYERNSTKLKFIWHMIIKNIENKTYDHDKTLSMGKIVIRIKIQWKKILKNDTILTYSEGWIFVYI